MIYNNEPVVVFGEAVPREEHEEQAPRRERARVNYSFASALPQDWEPPAHPGWLGQDWSPLND